MKSAITQSAPTKKIQVFSPHFDDAVLSVGQHMIEWKAAGYQVEVVTVFTEFAATVLSIDTQRFLQASGVQTAAELQTQRQREDRAALQQLGVTSQWLGLTDGGFREHHSRPVYLSHRQLFSGQVRDDHGWVQRCEQRIRAAIWPGAVVVAPLGIGHHADHLLLRQILERNVTVDSLRWYVDIPYAFQLENWDGRQLRRCLRRHKSLRWSQFQKLKSLGAYRSQLPALFPDGVWEYPECVIE